MRIGIDASRANVRERTGTERYSFQIIASMVAIDASDTFILYIDDAPLPELTRLGPNVVIRRLRWPFRFLWSQLRLSFEMLVRPPEVLFVPAHTIPIVHPRATVTTLHDLGFEHDASLYGSRQIGGPGVIGTILNVLVRTATLGKYGNSELDYHRWSARFAVRHAKRLITVSRFSQQDISDHYHIPVSRIDVIYHGFDPVEFARPPATQQHEVQKHFSIQPPYLLFVGRLERKKNILALVTAFKEARCSVPGLSLVLIGKSGLGWDDAKAFVERHGLTGCVHQLGWQPKETTVPLMAGATALVLLSEFEGFGFPILESYAVGTPVIASRLAALPEIADDGALLVDPQNTAEVAASMIEIVTDPNKRATMITLGTRRAEDFSWKRSGQQTLNVLISSVQP